MTTFARLFVPDALRDAVSDRAWLEGMLDAERALVNASSLAGVVPAHFATAITEQCEPSLYDVDELCEQGRLVGNPVEPLVRALRARVTGAAAGYVHLGATSQDVLDTAAMLVIARARAGIDVELVEVAQACAQLASAHRGTRMAARTLLQQAVPTTFGATAAGWLVDVVDARAGLRDVALPAQLGGAAGTLAAFGERGEDVLRLYATELELAEPVVPWHTRRAPVARVAAALAAVAAACSKIALDVILLSQTEIAEVAEGPGGGSSTMPNKHNPARSVLARACARHVHANAALLASGEHELQRAAGAWQAEWPALSATLAFAGGAAAATRHALVGLTVDAERMRANMTSALDAERDGLVERGVIAPDDDYLGSAGAFVDRALARHRDES